MNVGIAFCGRLESFAMASILMRYAELTDRGSDDTFLSKVCDFLCESASRDMTADFHRNDVWAIYKEITDAALHGEKAYGC